jgi:hypothetical protein
MDAPDLKITFVNRGVNGKPLTCSPGLDFAKATAQKQSQVISPSANVYAGWRLRSGLAGGLRDDADSPPERLLQAVWQHQRLRRDQLRTLEGKPVRVLHPGFGNFEGGPDFRNALIQLGDDSPRSGDVEVDLRSSGWHAHGHDRNTAFKNVILHVVWDAEARADGGPEILLLRQALDAPLGELNVWLERDPVKTLPDSFRGKCCAPLRELSADQLTELLQQAAFVRLQAKATQFQARARHVGWEQSLWEGLFRALGYKHNVWPMQCLAETRSRWNHKSESPLSLQARLFGISGLLPAEPTRKQSASDNYLRQVWDRWWRERNEFEDCLLPKTAWRFHGLRPANHPQRRLALASHWLGRDLPAHLEKWCGAGVAEKSLATALHKILQGDQDEYWSWHWTFRSARLKKSQPLLGGTRVTDLAVNVVLPWLWTRALEGKNETLQKEIERRYFAWPPAEDNSLLRLARQRLLGGASQRACRTAAAQQGLIQIVRDFCDHSNAACDNCEFPELVKDWRAQK